MCMATHHSDLQEEWCTWALHMAADWQAERSRLNEGCCMPTWMMPYSRTETAMMMAPLGVKPSVVTPVRHRS